MRLIGITGGVGAGKSELLSFIRRHYICRICLADEAAHLVQRKGEPCWERLVELLGRGILDETGEIHRGRMAEAIFGNPQLLEAVNAIVHPAVKDYLLEQVRQARLEGKTELFFIEAALLIEGGYKAVVDELWYIYAREEVRRARLERSRGYSPEKIRDIMDSQLSDGAFREACDFVLDNSGPLDESFARIRERPADYTYLE